MGDPLGFTNDGDAASFNRRRGIEIKHGRICMLATMGYITPEITGKLPGYLSPSQGLKFEDIPNGLGAISKVPAAGWLQIVAYFGFCEFSGGFEDYKSGTPGDYGWKVLTSDDQAEKTKKLSAEIANGRLAMVAIIGMFFQDGLTGSAWGDWASYTDSPLRAFEIANVRLAMMAIIGMFYQDGLTGSAWGDWELYTGSPLRAFESELGAQPPLGFWDPLGFCDDGDAEVFRRRRILELKHGRVSMLAAVGYIVPEYFKFDFLIAPSDGLKGVAIDNGLAALKALPPEGWAQMFAFCGYLEFGPLKQDESRKPGDCEGFGR